MLAFWCFGISKQGCGVLGEPHNKDHVKVSHIGRTMYGYDTFTSAGPPLLPTPSEVIVKAEVQAAAVTGLGDTMQDAELQPAKLSMSVGTLLVLFSALGVWFRLWMKDTYMFSAAGPSSVVTPA